MNESIRKQLMESAPPANKGQSHIFLGNPLSDAVDKTTVEQGNIFSPGMWTYGVFNMICDGGNIWDYSCADKKSWRFDEGAYPIARADYSAEGAFDASTSLFHLGSSGAFGVDFYEAAITAHRDGMSFVIALAEEGPAGGTINSIKAIENGVEVNTSRAVFERAYDEIIIAADGKTAYCIYNLREGEELTVRLRAIHSFADRAFGGYARTNSYDTLPFDEARARAQSEWAAFKTQLLCPDARLQRAYNNSLFHILNAMEAGLPRISSWNYPVFWIRDCVIVLRALDYAGRTDLARIGCDYLSGLTFSGGFGSESDNPGEGIWALASHYQFTDDKQWLESVYPDIVKRVGWIKRMMTADKPIFRSGDSRTAWAINQPGVNVVCLESNDGVVHGRMDWHSPDFYINCWCYSGLYEAAKLAQVMGCSEQAKQWSADASSLKDAITNKLLPSVGNERDTCVTPYPCGIYSADNEPFAKWFGEFYKAVRLKQDGSRNPEGLWTYFEAAQIHNAYLLGFEHEAWTSLDGFLSDAAYGEMDIYFEGNYGATEMLPYCNAPWGSKGWLKQGAIGGNMPHNWTSAETFNLIREMFVREDMENGKLLLASFVSEVWRGAGCVFGVKDMPTAFGEISYTLTFAEDGSYKAQIDFDGEYEILV